jgi:hypothetical protein
MIESFLMLSDVSIQSQHSGKEKGKGRAAEQEVTKEKHQQRDGGTTSVSVYEKIMTRKKETDGLECHLYAL